MYLCATTLSNLLEFWFCINVKLVLLWISRMLGTRMRMHIFAVLSKTMNIISVKKVIFLKIRHFFIAKMEKASGESWAKQESNSTTKTFSCNRWPAIWFVSASKMTSQTKILISTSVYAIDKKCVDHSSNNIEDYGLKSLTTNHIFVQLPRSCVSKRSKTMSFPKYCVSTHWVWTNLQEKRGFIFS